MQRRILLVIGPSGAGKTRTVSELIEHIDRVAIFDMVKDSQYTDRKDVIVISGRPKDFGRTIGAIKDALPSPNDNILKDQDKRFKVVYHPVALKVEDNGLVSSPELGMIVEMSQERGHMYLVIDEAHLFCNSYNCPKELMMATLIGRHDELSLILVAQSFTGVHPAIRRNTDEIYFWKIIEPNELDAVKERCGKDVMQQVKDLRAVELDDDNNFKMPGQRLHWSKFKGVVEVTE